MPTVARNNEWVEIPEQTKLEVLQDVGRVAVEVPRVFAVVAYASARGLLYKISDKISDSLRGPDDKAAI